MTIKRKVIQIANSTMLVSLPREWAKKNNLVKGQEVDVVIDKNKVQISTDSKGETKSITVDVSKKLELIEKIIGAIYRAGYDEVELLFSSNEEHKKIHSVVGNNVIGFEIVDEKKNKVIVKAVSSIDSKEFDTMLRRGFLFLISMGEDSLTFLKESKFSDLAGIELRDNNINKISDFCRRTLNKHGHKNFSLTSTIYSVAIGIERLGDAYKDIASYCSIENIKPSQKSLELFQSVNALIRDFYECFYNFSLEKVWDIMQKKKEIVSLTDSLTTTLSKKEIKLINTLSYIAGYTSDMTGVLMVNFL